MEHESDGDTNFNWRTRYSHQRIDIRIGGLGKKDEWRPPNQQHC